MAHPMGEVRNTPLRVNFDRRLKLEFHGGDISSDGGRNTRVLRCPDHTLKVRNGRWSSFSIAY